MVITFPVGRKKRYKNLKIVGYFNEAHCEVSKLSISASIDEEKNVLGNEH